MGNCWERAPYFNWNQAIPDHALHHHAPYGLVATIIALSSLGATQLPPHSTVVQMFATTASMIKNSMLRWMDWMGRCPACIMFWHFRRFSIQMPEEQPARADYLNKQNWGLQQGTSVPFGFRLSGHPTQYHGLNPCEFVLQKPEFFS